MTDDAFGELARLYAALDAEIEKRGWRCRACGRCCRFAEHGHDLFCSELEAEFVTGSAEFPGVISDDVCPFLSEGGCTRRDRRALACRTYFCDAAESDEMTGLSETYVRRLKSLHGRLGLSWRYERLTTHLRRRKSLSDK